MAESSTQGMLVAPSTRIPSLLFPTPAVRWLRTSSRDSLNAQVLPAPTHPWHGPPPTLHLHQELGLDAPGRLTLVLVAGATQRVHLIDEDDGGFVLPCQLKQVLHQPGNKAEDGVPAQRPSSAPPWQPQVPPRLGTPHWQQGKCHTRNCALSWDPAGN